MAASTQLPRPQPPHNPLDRSHPFPPPAAPACYLIWQVLAQKEALAARQERDESSAWAETATNSAVAAATELSQALQARDAALDLAAMVREAELRAARAKRERDESSAIAATAQSSAVAAASECTSIRIGLDRTCAEGVSSSARRGGLLS